MRPDDLLITGSSLGNPPIRQLVEAASGAGFVGLSLWPRETWLPALEAGWTAAELRRLLSDHGLVVNDIDALSIRCDVDPPRVTRSGTPDHVIFEAGEALAARYLNVLLIAKETPPIDQSAAALSGVCARAAEHGLRVHVEFAPLPATAVRTAAEAWQVIEASGTDAGLMIDTWHCLRGPTTLDDIAALPGDRILGIQVSDAPEEPGDDLMEETLSRRLPPGEGVFDYAGFNRALLRAGSRAPFTVEVFSDTLLPRYGAVDLARRLYSATRRAAGR